ncbi:MAG: phosphodiester glycosidase family protein [Oscillospiraceae bacterium]|nr:phosphodiester glycosidase family protein [Oscillospiraceae bacterium]
MKRKLLRAGTSLFIILAILVSTAVYAIGNTVYTNTRWLANNLQYINTISWLGAPGRAESFQLRLTGAGDAFPIVMTGPTVAGANRISEIVSHAEGLGYNVLAAVNSDFFSMQTGIPMGIVIENGIYKSSASRRAAVAFDNNGGVFFIPSPHVQITLTNNGGGFEVYNAGETVRLYHFNKARVDTGGMYLFSEAFSNDTTRTSSPGWSVRFRILYGVPTVSGEMTLQVVDKIQSDGDMYIGQGYMVLTAAEQSGWCEVHDSFAIGDIVTMTTTANDERLAQAQFATGGGDILVANGIRTDADEWDQALRARAPRTAFGLREDGSVISIVVDGRNSPYSVGLTMDELADEFIRQGAVYAVNFDGGGSSAISVRLPGEQYSRVISRPSDGAERRCSTYILFVTNAVSDGFVRNLHLENDGIIVLAGSSTYLNFIATDGGYMPVTAPYDITAVATAYDSFISGTWYTAGSIAGSDVITLQSASTGAQGVGEIFVITEPTSIIVSRREHAARLTSVTLQPGDVFEFDVAATFYRRNVISQMDAFTYTVDGDIGEFTELGVFVAGETIGERGTITVSAGDRHEVIEVEIGGGFEDMQDHWARGYVEYLFNAGIVTGITPETYGPNLEIRRGDFVLMLHRAAGEPIPGSSSDFEDVPFDVYFADAVAWAQEMGIAQGVGGNRFNPLSPLTRQEAFTFVYRALGILDIEVSEYMMVDLSEFTDYDSISEFAVIPTATLVGLGVVGGADGRLMPGASLTRAQMARVLASVLWI